MRKLTVKITDSSKHSSILLNDECTLQKGCTKYGATMPAAVTLDMSGFTDGLYKLNMEGMVTGNSDPLTLSIYFYHHKVKE